MWEIQLVFIPIFYEGFKTLVLVWLHLHTPQLWLYPFTVPIRSRLLTFSQE